MGVIQKIKLRRAIRTLKREIEQIEQRRNRSQAAIVKAILSGTQPDDCEVDYFNQFTRMIEREREALQTMLRELSGK